MGSGEASWSVHWCSPSRWMGCRRIPRWSLRETAMGWWRLSSWSSSGNEKEKMMIPYIYINLMGPTGQDGGGALDQQGHDPVGHLELSPCQRLALWGNDRFRAARGGRGNQGWVGG